MLTKLYLLPFLFLTLQLSAQINTELLSNLPYNDHISDVWGYVDSDGGEYALVGALDGVSIVSLADPTTPVELHFVPGVATIWRDIKTFGDYAYVTNDGEDGVVIIDLSELPTSIESYVWQPSITGASGVVESCHNLYIDEAGIIYLAGCNLNDGGVIMADAAANPIEPPVVGVGAARYAHDVFARDNIMYSSEIGLGQFTITDVTDKDNPQLLGNQTTPFNFTHHSWLSDDGQTLFLTDEVGDAPVSAYDISDYNDIELLDEFRPLATIGQGVVPHNVHFINDYLVVSYYTDGVVIVDASRPTNLIEVGNYDTFLGASGDFFGAWGAYPYLPSGNILVTDQSTGLYILRPNYQRAAYLEGLVVDAMDEMPINDVTIEILNTSIKANTDATGRFATGLADNGTFEVRFSKFGYTSQTVTITLEQGQVTEQIVSLEKLAGFVLTGKVTDITTGEPIAGGKIRIVGNDNDITITADMQGEFLIDPFFTGDYQIYIGKWGYKTKILNAQTLDVEQNTIEVTLQTGIEDLFLVDLGWQTEATNNTGNWELAVPPLSVVAPYDETAVLSPPTDTEADNGNGCFVTSNSTELMDGVLEGGISTLLSPIFDLTGFTDPVVSFYTWYVNVDSNDGTAQNSSFAIRLNNGTRNVSLASIKYSDTIDVPTWQYHEYRLAELIELTNNMQMRFIARGFGENEIIEAGIDFFQIKEADPTAVIPLPFVDYPLTIAPNPTRGTFSIDYALPIDKKEKTLLLFNNIGQLIQQIPLHHSRGILLLGESLTTGLYWIQIITEDGQSTAQKMIKVD